MHLIGRRNFVAGAGLGAGAHLLGSIFKELLPEALGQVSRKKRWIMYCETGGLLDTGPTAGPSETEFDLRSFAPLAPYRNEILYVAGLYNPFHGGLHDNVTANLTAAAAGGSSIDRQLAKTIGKTDAWPSINLSLVEQAVRECYDDGAPYPIETNPVEAFGKIFGGGARGGGASSGVNTADLLARRKSLLDYVKGDVMRLNARLAGPEKAKAAQYIESVRDVERRLALLANVGAGQGPTTGCGPKAPAFVPGRQYSDPVAGIRAGTAWAEVFEAVIDITVNAIACGLTRVAFLHTGVNVLYSKALNVSAHGKGQWCAGHGFLHGGVPEAKDPYFQWQARYLAMLRDRLGKLRDSAGTLAENTLIVYYNVGGGTHHGGYDKQFMFTIGTAGGYFRTGRFITLAPQQHSVNDAFVSQLNAMGAPDQTFGTVMLDPQTAAGYRNASKIGGGRVCKGPIPVLSS